MSEQVRQSFRRRRSSAFRATLTDRTSHALQSIDLEDLVDDDDDSATTSGGGFDDHSTEERLPLILEGGNASDIVRHDIVDFDKLHRNETGTRHPNSTSSSESRHRVRSIDLLRGLSVLGMVLVHYMIYYGNEKAMESLLYFVLSDGLGNVGAAGFLVLSGMSHALAADGRVRKAMRSGHQPWKECDEFRCTWTRSLKLLGVELLMLALAWGPREMIKWDILTLQASSTLVLYVCRYLPSWTVASVAAGIAVATPALRSLSVVDFESAWGGGFREAPFTEKFAPGLVYDPVAGDLEVHWDVKSILQGYALTGIFPLFPWVLFPLVGHIMGRRIVSNQFRHDIAVTVIIGATFMVLGMGGAVLSRFLDDPSVVTGYLSPLSFYPDSFTMVLVQLGFVLVVIPLAYYHYDVRNRDDVPVHQKKEDDAAPAEPFLHRVFNLTSRWALPIYFLHYICISWPLAVHYYLGKEGTYPIFDWMGAIPALLAGVVAVVGLVGLAAVLEHGCPTALLCARIPTAMRYGCGRSRPTNRRRESSMAARLSRRLGRASAHRRLSFTIPVV